MRAKGHGTAGMIAGGTAAAAPYVLDAVPVPPDSPHALAAIVLGCLIGGFTGLLPDMIESSKRRGPNHRRFFHSWIFLLALFGVGYAVYLGKIPAISPSGAWLVVLPAIAGYASHLLTDFPTKKGLPFV